MFYQPGIIHTHTHTHRQPKLKLIPIFLAAVFTSAFFISCTSNGVNAADADYYQIFSDDFNRDDTTGTAIDNGWSFPGGYNCDGIKPNTGTGITTWSIRNNVLFSAPNTCDDRSNNGARYAFRSSPMLQTSQSIYNGKITYDWDTTLSGASSVHGAIARYNPIDGSGLFFGVDETPNDKLNMFYFKLLNPGNFGDISSNTTNLGAQSYVGSAETLPTHLRVELLLQDNTFEFNIYDIDTSLTEPIYSTIHTNDNMSTLTGRTWGIQAHALPSAPAALDNFVLYKEKLPLTIATIPASIMQIGSSISYNIIDDETRDLSNFSDGAGGTFSPSSIQLTADNNYTATVTYTPIKSGHHTITANVTGDETFSHEILVQPYSTKIGMLGDSITAHNNTNLGNNLSIVNVAVCSGLVAEFANNNMTSTKCGGLVGAQNIGDPWQTIAINTLKENGVDLVHIMLGTNDTSKYTATQYKTNMQTSINALKAAGIKHVILSKLIWRQSESHREKVIQYNAVIDELVDENNGYALAGDFDAYTWFEANNSEHMSDGLHPTTAIGRQTLANFWTTAITRNLEYQVAPEHSWVDNNSSHRLGEIGTLTHTIDKYLDHFTGTIKVDGTTLSVSDYTTTSGSTIVELSNAFLNTLASGDHTLTVEFYGNVLVSSSFTIDTPADPNTPNVPNTGEYSANSSDTAINTTSPIIGIAVVILGAIAIIIKRR